MIVVEQCVLLLRRTGCSYYPKFLLQQREIASRAPGVKVSGAVGRVGAFEVVVDGKLAHSKLATGAFPDFGRLASDIATYAQSGKAPGTWK